MTKPLTADELATALVRSLKDLLPTTRIVELFAHGDTIRVEDSRACSVLLELGTYGTSPQLTAEEALAAVRSVLSTVQDVVSEALTEPWPQTPSGSMAQADAAIEDGWIIGTFGDPHEGAPHLRIVPVS